MAAAALERCGHPVSYELSGGAADANVFNERGLEIVNLANGMTDIHTPNEHIAVADLEAMVDVTLALVDGAARLDAGMSRAMLERHADLVRCEVDGAPCVAYPPLTGPVDEGDEVLVNVQARELELGSGGFDLLYANLTRGLELPVDAAAHVMALPYAPGQWAVRHAEEDGELAAALEGRPVVLCTVHSRSCRSARGSPACGSPIFRWPAARCRSALSDALRALRARELVVSTASVAPCFGGDVRCVSVASARCGRPADHDVACARWARASSAPERVSATAAVSLAEAANVASALGGVPILAQRVSSADERERHRGVSHHTRAVLDLALGDVVIAPADLGEGWQDACAGLPLSHMGRGPDDEAEHFAAAYAAGRLAAGRARMRER